MFVIDSTDKERIEECWAVFGALILSDSVSPGTEGSHHAATLVPRARAEEIVTDSRVDGVPTLVLANKQDCEGAMAVEDIKQMFNKLIVGKMNVSEGGVLPISALRG